MTDVSLRSVLLELPERGENRLSASVEYVDKAPTSEKTRKAAVDALRAALDSLESKEIADMGHRDDDRRQRRVQCWAIEGER